MKTDTPEWLKHKGYLHLTPHLDIITRKKELVDKITNPKFISCYAFYPLIHSSIKERKFKKNPTTQIRSHSHPNEAGVVISSAKDRPLHYSSHMDALIFGYYAELIQNEYEKRLHSRSKLSESVIAYRRIPTNIDSKNKSTIHFAKEVFDEIKHRTLNNECAVLMFDIKSFFSSIDHVLLRKAWENLFNVTKLPSDHYNVYKAATRFSYILKDDLRMVNNKPQRKPPFNEKKLSEIRKTGKFCFFESPKEFREKIKLKQLKVYKHPFTNTEKEPVGIPQGLAISAVLANLYLLEFDNDVIDTVVDEMGGFYRRYSDDILIICNTDHAEKIKDFITASILKNKVEISKAKTEEYIFKKAHIGKKIKLTSIKIVRGEEKIGIPLTYLGFEFYGDKILIKSANLSKFYRRMIRSVKSKAKRAQSLSKISPDNKLAVFRRQLHKIYTLQDLSSTKIKSSVNKLVKNERGYYDLRSIKIDRPLKSNYLSYVHRASQIMEDEAIVHQIRNHQRIFNEAIYRHLKEKKYYE